MGNDQSHLAGIQIEEKSVQVSDFWTHHSATIINSENTTSLSVLIGELFVDGQLWKTHTPLEKNSKHLMIYRHPCILKYISSWHKSSKFYLALEEVVPLSHVLASQNTLQICIGLHSILKALCFLHEKAAISHNNICTASIYITKEGSWKLGGMEYVCKFSELTSDYLKKSNNNRYNKAIDPNEEKHIQSSSRRDFIDIFAYGVLVCEVLKSKIDDISSLMSFQNLCKNCLQNIDVDARPKLSALLEHEFFNHEFIVIHSFLIELPLKSDEEKIQFFHGLVERLRAFPDDTVASQFGSLLLSRLVLLNKAAQDKVLPFIFCPKKRKSSEDTENFFLEDTFRKYLAPKLLEIFCVRDAQIRLLLLNYFKHFVHIFTKEELQSCILPELLVGVKDTNDHLVSVTLRTLADLVPILGAPTVIGGKRGKLFTDGRPVPHPGRRPRKNSKKQEPAPNTETIITNPIIQTNQVIMNLPERPRPDGEEGEETSTEEAEQSVEEDLDNWEDWGESNPAIQDHVESSSVHTNSSESVVSVFERNESETREVAASERNENVTVLRKKSLPDIAELDIKNQATVNENDEFDFFQDMEPVIEASSKFLMREDLTTNVSSKLNLAANEEGNEDGWIDEEW